MTIFTRLLPFIIDRKSEWLPNILFIFVFCRFSWAISHRCLFLTCLISILNFQKSSKNGVDIAFNMLGEYQENRMYLTIWSHRRVHGGTPKLLPPFYFYLGNMYLNGQAVEENHKLALQLFQRGATKGIYGIM